MSLALDTLWDVYNAEQSQHRVMMAVAATVHYITIEGGGVNDHADRLAFAAAFVAATDDKRRQIVKGLTALVLGNPSIANAGATASDDDIRYVVSTTLASVPILHALTAALA